MNKTPLFSIITINYNDKSGIEQSIFSLINQTFLDFEYIVIDGGSSDGSVAIIEKYKDKIDYWVSEPDKGIYDAMNKGLKQVNGDYVYFLNSGDYFLSNHILEFLSKQLVENKADVLVTGVLKLDPLSGRYSIDSPNLIDKISLFKSMICHQALFVRKNVIDTVGNFDMSYKIKADYEWLLRLVSVNKYSFKYTNTVTTFYPLGGASDTQYNTYSVKEIPKIRKLYYSEKADKFLRRYVYRPSLKRYVDKLLRSEKLRNRILSKI